MNLYKLIRSLLFLLPAEGAHSLTLALAQTACRSPKLLTLINKRLAFYDKLPDPISQDLCGLHFPTPIGLAAGLDKCCSALRFWEALGFGFETGGTITGRKQGGNPKPRLFREPELEALLNRFGFNNDGALATSERLQKQCGRLPDIPTGVSLGKSAAVPANEIDAVILDHLYTLDLLHDFFDYFEANISSPNTPGVRGLAEKEFLEPFLAAIIHRLEKLWKKQQYGNYVYRPYRDDRKTDRKALWVKLSPDMSAKEVEAAIELIVKYGADGVILSNTSVDPTLIPRLASEKGGRSGPFLFPKTVERVRLVRSLAPKLLIIASGGISKVEHIVEVLTAGASLTQVYTGFIYGGYAFPGNLARDLHQHMKKNCMTSISDFHR
jgi:dihydroorotate dehydrogenase